MQKEHRCSNPVAVTIATSDAAGFFDSENLSDSDRDRFSRLRSPLHRHEFAVSRALQQHFHPTGGPVSWSHSVGLAAFAHGPPGSRIGVDLEAHRPRRHLSIARFAYSVEESDWLAAETADSASLFYALWVAKEAVAKALGIPLIEALRDCRLLRKEGAWVATIPTSLAWSLTVLKPRPDLSLAVALFDHPPGEVSVQTREWPPERAVDWPVVVQLSG